VSGLRGTYKGVHAFDEALRIRSGPTDAPDSGTHGCDRIVDQAGIEYAWEWVLIDTSRPLARGLARGATRVSGASVDALVHSFG
jgi:hypothetical protein